MTFLRRSHLSKTFAFITSMPSPDIDAPPANVVEAAVALWRVEERFPARLQLTSLSNQLLDISKDRLRVTYKGHHQHPNEAGAVLSDHPIPLNRKVYYYEVYVHSKGEKGAITIGFTRGDFELQRRQGSEGIKYGYNGWDGHVYSGSDRRKEYGPCFTTGDTVGAGIHLEKQQIFFTKNGKFIKVAFENAQGELYPVVRLYSKDECVDVNFGQKPFAYDLDGMLQEEAAKVQSEIKNVEIVSGNVHAIVRRYLLHYGYASTLEAFDHFCGVESDAHRSLEFRARLRQDVIAGRIDDVLRHLKEYDPKLIASSITDLLFTLLCQKFIELVRAGKVEKALVFAQNDLHPFRKAGEKYAEKLSEIVPLMAYADPETSKLKHLFSAERREYVADVLNATILEESGEASISSMERLLKQLVATHHQLHEENQNQGEVFNLRAHLTD